jgi:hypothetical protein
MTLYYIPFPIAERGNDETRSELIERLAKRYSEMPAKDLDIVVKMIVDELDRCRGT